jgi:DedD protein
MRLEANDRDDEVSGPMAEPPDTEITLGTGKMLVLFFGLVVLCSVFFALGFKLGKGSANGPELSSTPSSTTTGNPAAKPATKPADLSFYKSVGQDSPSTQLTPPENTAKPADKPADGTASSTAPTDQTAAPAPSSNYYVQVAAVSKQEDAEALVDALKKKQYAAFATSLGDKLYHIQVGPFPDVKEAEATRAKLVGDGYNPILKK